MQLSFGESLSKIYTRCGMSAFGSAICCQPKKQKQRRWVLDRNIWLFLGKTEKCVSTIWLATGTKAIIQCRKTMARIKFVLNERRLAFEGAVKLMEREKAKCLEGKDKQEAENMGARQQDLSS